MDYAALLISVAMVDFAAAATPGPNFVLVAETAMRSSRRAAAAVVAGFVLSNLIWCAAVVAGLSTLFAVSPLLYTLLRVAGGAYLIYLGVSLWLRRDAGIANAVEPAAASISQPLVRGVITNLANAKSAIYFGSIFAAFLRPGTPEYVYALAIAIVVANTIVWYGTVAFTFSRERIRRRYLSLRRIIDRAAGTLMVAFGVRLMIEGDE